MPTSRRPPPPLSTAVASIAALVLLVAACGNDKTGDGDSAKPAATSTSTSSVPADQVPAVPSKGCEVADRVGPGDATVDLPTSAGEAATYLRHVPPQAATATPLPLVVDLHGYSSPASVQSAMSGYPTLADGRGFVTVTPDITRKVPRWDVGLGSGDVEWVGTMLDHVEASVCIDTARVFVSGLSNGAMMTTALACVYADRFAAAAPVAGVTDLPGCAPARPVPLIAFHGTADPFLPWTGGVGPGAKTLPLPDGSGSIGDAVDTAAVGEAGVSDKSVPDRVAAWAARNGCDATPAEAKEGADVTVITYPCPPGADVVLYKVEGGGHAWPGSAFSKSIESVIGPTTMTVDATKLAVDFFLAHPLRS